MSIGYRRFPEQQTDRSRVSAILDDLNKAQKLLDLTKHEGWEVLNDELTRRELGAMQQLASGPTDVDSIAFNRAVAQICRYLRELPERQEQERDTRQAELDLVAPQNGR